MKKNLSILALLFTPSISFAATDFASVGTLVNNFTTNVVTAVGYLMLTLAVVVFFWGIVEFIWAAREGKVEEKTKGRAMMTWGLVALFVMFSVWGIISFAQGILGSEFKTTTITVPKLKFDGSGSTPSNGSPLSPENAFCSNPGQEGRPCGAGKNCSGGMCVDVSNPGE